MKLLSLMIAALFFLSAPALAASKSKKNKKPQPTFLTEQSLGIPLTDEEMAQVGGPVIRGRNNLLLDTGLRRSIGPMQFLPPSYCTTMWQIPCRIK